MCGGSGTRLWPLSRRDHPKQFAVMKEGKSLFERTFERAVSIAPQKVICVAHQNYRFLINDIIGEDGNRHVLLLEPEPRNTAAAIASVALYVAATNPEAILACMPADHEIGSSEALIKSVKTAAAVAAQGWITVLGVTPTYAATAYGYIQPGKPIADDSWTVERFIEKPEEIAAREYYRAGYWWNSGLVVARADVLIAALAKHAPEVLSACREAQKAAIEEFGHISLDREAFLASPSISFDYAVLENHDCVAVVELAGYWSDVGSWTEFAKLIPEDGQRNRVSGQVELLFCENVFIQSPDRFTVGLGLRDIVVVDTPDALLVASASAVGELKNLVTKLLAENRSEAITIARSLVPWGWLQWVDRGENFSGEADHS